jgi:hypothetical protein
MNFEPGATGSSAAREGGRDLRSLSPCRLSAGPDIPAPDPLPCIAHVRDPLVTDHTDVASHTTESLVSLQRDERR